MSGQLGLCWIIFGCNGYTLVTPLKLYPNTYLERKAKGLLRGPKTQPNGLKDSPETLLHMSRGGFSMLYERWLMSIDLLATCL